MSADDVMMAMALGGLVLTGIYIAAELALLSHLPAREARRQEAVKALYAAPSVPSKMPNAVCLQGAAANQSECRFRHAA